MRVTDDLVSGLARPTKEEHLVARPSLLPDRSEDEASIAAALNEALRWGRPMEGAKLQQERAGVLQGLGSAGDIDRSDARDLLARLYCSHTYREIRALADPERELPGTMLPIDDAARDSQRHTVMQNLHRLQTTYCPAFCGRRTCGGMVWGLPKAPR